MRKLMGTSVECKMDCNGFKMQSYYMTSCEKWDSIQQINTLLENEQLKPRNEYLSLDIMTWHVDKGRGIANHLEMTYLQSWWFNWELY